MRSPYSDPRLSLKARGLYAMYIEYGRVLSADELSAAVPEGRDSIRAAMKELKLANYIRAVRQNINGRWITHLKFSDERLNMPFSKTPAHTDDGFSGVCYIDNYSTNSDIANSSNSNTVTNVTVLLREQAPEEDKMGWNLDGEEEAPQPKKKFGLQIDDDLVGSVGQVVDKAAMRRVKYKQTKLEAHPESMHRAERPEETWSTKDLIAEFYDLLREKAPGVPSQVNATRLAGWINKHVGQGTPRVAILKAIRMFFDDPRMFHDVGIGRPLMERFMAYYPSVHGIVNRAETSYVDDDFLAHQEKMLKLLEG